MTAATKKTSFATVNVRCVILDFARSHACCEIKRLQGSLQPRPQGAFPWLWRWGRQGDVLIFYLCCILCFFVVDCEQSAFTLKTRRVRRLIMSERVGAKNALSQKETGARRVVGTWNVQVKSFSFPEMRWSPQFTFCLFLNSIYFPVWHYLANSWSYFIFYKLKSGGGGAEVGGRLFLGASTAPVFVET